MDGYTIRRHGQREYAEMDGQTYYTRLIGETEWEAVDRAPAEAEPTLKLTLVRQNQAAGEPLHWSLVVHYEGETSGSVYQVKGDATDMRHVFADNVDLFNSQSYRDYFELATIEENDIRTINYYATQEAPPSASSQATVTENCQGWSIRVIRRLVANGIVHYGWVSELERLLDPLS